MRRTMMIVAGVAAIYFITVVSPVESDGRGRGGGGGGSRGAPAQRGPRQGGDGHQGRGDQGRGDQGRGHQSGGHQGGRTGNTISRTPSMSRSAPAPWRGGAHHRPSQREVQQFIQAPPRPGLQGQAGSGVIPPRGQFTPTPSLQGQAGSGVLPPPGKPFTPVHPGRPGVASPRTIGGNRSMLNQPPQTFKSSFPRQRMNNRQTSRHTRERIKQNRPQVFNSFNDRFFDSHHFKPRNHFPGANWWCSPWWPGVVGWLGWGWSYPLYYDDTGYVYPDTTYQTYPESSNTGEFAQANQQAIQGDWLSLGVFAIGQNTTEASYSSIVIQLALNKEGEISGTYYNSATNQTYQIEGTVDKTTQEAQWKLSDDPFAPTMSTGVYNLTQEVTNVQVQFPEGTLQNWVLVRLNS